MSKLFYRHRSTLAPMPPSCEVCDTPAVQGFYVRFCLRFHNQEFLCPQCCKKIDKIMGEKFLRYLGEHGGCLFEEFSFFEKRLGEGFQEN